jgi:hypothetical protein
VTATDLEERIERLFFGLTEPSPGSDSVPEPDLHRYVGQYRDGSRLVRVAMRAGMLTVHPGLGHHTDSRLMPGGGGWFLDAEEPSIELRFQIRDEQAHGYGRYHNGWFVGVGVRSEDRARAAGQSGRVR